MVLTWLEDDTKGAVGKGVVGQVPAVQATPLVVPNPAVPIPNRNGESYLHGIRTSLSLWHSISKSRFLLSLRDGVLPVFSSTPTPFLQYSPKLG